MTGNPWYIRPYRPEDCPALLRLFQLSVHTLCRGDYSPQQLDAWAAGSKDIPRWAFLFQQHHTLVAQKGSQIIGFADINENGYLDHLYIHPA